MAKTYLPQERTEHIALLRSYIRLPDHLEAELNTGVKADPGGMAALLGRMVSGEHDVNDRVVVGLFGSPARGGASIYAEHPPQTQTTFPG